jgi:hypothetical protein
VDLTALAPLGDQLEPFRGSLIPDVTPQETWGVIGDLDEDGAPELILGQSSWGANGRPSETQAWRVGPLGELTRDRALEASIGSYAYPPMAAIDLDADGHLDLIYPDPVTTVRWGGGDGTFLAPAPIGLGLAGGTRAYYGIGFADVDRDGWLDLLVGDRDCDGVVIPALRERSRVFTLRPDLVVESTAGSRTDAVLAVPRPDGGDLWVAITWPCDVTDSHPGTYVVPAPSGADWPRATAQGVEPPGAWWQFNPVVAGRPFTVLAPMAVEATDVDGDGLLDLGLALGAPPFAWVQGMPDGTFVDRGYDAALFPPNQGPAGVTEPLMWAAASPDLDQDGRPDLLLALGDDATSRRLPSGITSQPVAWWNAGDWRFAEVTSAIGFGLDGNWKGLILDDLDRDGDADVLLGGYGVAPRLLRNDIEVGNHGFSLELRGTTSNGPGIGAVIEVEVAGLPRQTALMGAHGTPAGVGRPIVFFGTGASMSADVVRVRWPSGYAQEWYGLAADTAHTLTEASQVEVLSLDRRFVADGVTQVDVRLTPREPDGSIRQNVQVDLRIHGAPATLVSLARRGDGSYSARVRAPAAAGESVLEAVFDGVPARVRPRVWWVR